MIRALALLLLANSAFAAGPLFRHPDGKVNQEFENVYHDISNTAEEVDVDPLQTSSATITAATISSLRVSTATLISSATITNLTVSNLSGVTLGKVKQAVQGTSTTNFITNNAAYQTSNLSVSITPTANTSKVLVLWSGIGATGTGTMSVTVLRSGSDTLGGTVDGQGRYASSTPSQTILMSGAVLDSPATTSAITYAIGVRSVGGASVQFGQFGTQVIIAVEIGA